MWKLVEKNLAEFANGSTHYHKVVAVKLLSHGWSLPSNFVNDYKVRHHVYSFDVFIGTDPILFTLHIF